MNENSSCHPGQNRLDTSILICEPPTGIDPVTSFLPRTRSTTELGGQRENTLPALAPDAKSAAGQSPGWRKLRTASPLFAPANGPESASIQGIAGGGRRPMTSLTPAPAAGHPPPGTAVRRRRKPPPRWCGAGGKPPPRWCGAGGKPRGEAARGHGGDEEGPASSRKPALPHSFNTVMQTGAW